uniref:Uncharacterized protein n=1 Tax=Caenorhabditis japonica TaxID=281687 RepID=A0A8R1EGQ6_CAEJA
MTTTTMLTTLDLVTTPTDDGVGRRAEGGDDDFSTVVLSDAFVTQSAPSTPIQHREQANAEFGKEVTTSANMTAANVQKPSLNFYTDGFGQIREGLFSCFRPVLGYFGGRAPAEICFLSCWIHS